MRNADILVIGCGPGGMSAAQYSSRAGYKTLVLDPMGPGGQLLYIDEIENYPGKEKINGYALSEEMEKQCSSFGVEIEYAAVQEIKKEEDSFLVSSDVGEIKAKAVIIATGASHRHLGVKGEEKYSGRGVSYCATCDGPFYKGKKVVVVGGGDTALTDSMYLAKLCSHVTLVHRRESFRAQKALQDRLKSIENISTVMSVNITEIQGDGESVKSVLLDNGETIEADGVFVFVGTTPNSAFLNGLVETKDGFIVTDEKMASSVEGIFAVGDVRNTSFRQVVTACGDGARAAHSADEFIQNN